MFNNVKSKIQFNNMLSLSVNTIAINKTFTIFKNIVCIHTTFKYF